MSTPHHPIRRPLLFGACLLALLGLAAQHANGDVPDEIVRSALRRWSQVERSQELAPRVEAARHLARTRHPEALDRLLGIMARPGAYPEHLREQIAPIIAASFGGPRDARTFLTAFRHKLDEPEHAWLAWHVFRQWQRAHRDLNIQLVARAFVKQPFHQAAALDVLREDPCDRNVAIARLVLRALPREEPARTVVSEAAAALWIEGLRSRSRALRAVDLEPVLGILEHEDSTARTRLVIARQLARLLESDDVWLDAASWRRWLEDRKARETLEREGYATESKTTPSFLGIRARGRNVCYVIDVSGSMQAPIGGGRRPGGVIPPRRRGPATPGPHRPDPSKRRKKPPGVWDGVGDLPWERIHTRLGLVREALKASLRSLEKDQRFAIVFFATDARALSFTRSPRVASRGNVQRACSDLDALSASGATNLHRGIELAFGFTDRGIDTEGSAVSERHLEHGFDTIFLLTDGWPNVDSYTNGAPKPGRPWATRSLYAADDNLVLSLRRQNLFRRAQVHCIGMGNSPQNLLTRLAEVGGGEARFLGR